MKKKIAIFDLDGTLLNTLLDIGASMNRVLVRHGLPTHTIDEYRYIVGNGALKIAERASGNISPESNQQLCDEYNAEYGAHLVEETRPYDGIYDMLDALVEEGVTIGIFTNKPHKDMQTLMAKLLYMYPWFDANGQKAGVRLKPYPDVLLAMTEGMDDAEKFFIGDTIVDVETGHNAHFDTIGCAWGFRGKSELGDADFVAEHPMDVARYIISK